MFSIPGPFSLTQNRKRRYVGGQILAPGAVSLDKMEKANLFIAQLSEFTKDEKIGRVVLELASWNVQLYKQRILVPHK